MEEEQDIQEPLMSEDEMAERLSKLVGTTPVREDMQNTHTFLHNVATAIDTTKTGNVSVEELGSPVLPIRTYKELALFCDEVANMDYFAKYFLKKSEIVTSTSLSKEAKLLDLSVITKREVADVTKKPMKENRGWFKKKSSPPISAAD